MRRKASRSIDVKVLLDNKYWARKTIDFICAQNQADLTNYANTLQKLFFGKVSKAAGDSENEKEDEAIVTSKKNYIGYLRWYWLMRNKKRH